MHDELPNFSYFGNVLKPTLLKNISFTDIFLNNSPTPFGTIFNITSLSDCLEERILSQDQCLIFRHPFLR